MTTAFRGRVEDIGQGFLEKGIGYGVSIGRRAPMHRMHVDCIREIAEAGLKPVIVIGSVDGAESPLFNPVRNPFTVEQQKEQMRLALPDLYDEKLVIAQKDEGADDVWLATLKKNVQRVTGGGKAVLHFRSKASDEAASKQKIKSLSHYVRGFLDHGFSVWESFNKDPADDNIHASDIRRFDLAHLTPEQRGLISAPDYVVDLVKGARENNPDRSILQKNNIPLTILDLTLERMWREAGISTAAVFAAAGKEITLDSLSAAANQLVKSRAITPRTFLPVRAAPRVKRWANKP